MAANMAKFGTRTAATTVIEAFNSFAKSSVDLDRDETIKARASRDWLIEQLQGLSVKDSTFPAPYSEQYLGFGSFHRRTKIQPLDDIDLLACMSAEGSSYARFGDEIRILVPDSAVRLRALCHDNSNYLNSRRVINRFVQALGIIPQYREADIGRDGEAAVLGLTSYDWSFDIVPAFLTVPDSNNRTYYLIPDRAGHWRLTDPRVDQQRIRIINDGYEGALLPIVRLTKYWNRRRTMPTLRSYVLELLVLSHFRGPTTRPCSQYVDLAFLSTLENLQLSVLQPVADPAGIQTGDLNTLGWLERHAVAQRAQQDLAKARLARVYEEKGDYRAAIVIWRDIFGDELPSYG